MHGMKALSCLNLGISPTLAAVGVIFLMYPLAARYGRTRLMISTRARPAFRARHLRVRFRVNDELGFAASLHFEQRCVQEQARARGLGFNACHLQSLSRARVND
jgi:hypothetical protein